MRDALPNGKPYEYETAIVNLDSKFGSGTHWVCYKKNGNFIQYFDSFGDLRPPEELVKYFGPKVNVEYNYERKQGFDSVTCGHLCIEFLSGRNVLPERERFNTQP